MFAELREIERLEFAFLLSRSTLMLVPLSVVTLFSRCMNSRRLLTRFAPYLTVNELMR